MEDSPSDSLAFDRSPAYLQWRLDRIARRCGVRIYHLTDFHDQVATLIRRYPEVPQLTPWLEGIRDDFETVLSRRLEADQARYDLAVKRLLQLAQQYSLDASNLTQRFLLKTLSAYTTHEKPADPSAEKIAYYEKYAREHNAAVHRALPVAYDPAAAWLDDIWGALPNAQPARPAVDRLWFYQARDFGTSTPGGRVRVLDVATLLEPMPQKDGVASAERLARALAQAAARGCGETSRQIVEIEIPFGLMLFGTEELRVNGDFGELSNFVGKIEATLDGTVRLVSQQRDRMILRIPAASLLETLLESAIPERCPQFHFVDGAIPSEAANELHGQWKIPVGLCRQAMYLKDFRSEVHPFFYTFHDYFHGYMATYLPRSVVATSVELYRLAIRFLPESPFTRYHLNALVDLDPGVTEDRSMLRFFKKALNPLNKVMRDAEKMENVGRRRITADLQAGIRFLDAYLRMLREHPAANPETAGHFQEIETDLGHRLRAFQRELEAQQAAGGLESEL